jgi:hypothetical protein
MDTERRMNFRLCHRALIAKYIVTRFYLTALAGLIVEFY